MLFISNSYAKIIIVSDLDDTLKVTKVVSNSSMVWNGLFTKKVYAGIPLVLESLQMYVDETIVVTSSPTFVRSNILGLFEKFNIKVDQLVTRNILTQRSSRDFKFNKIVEIIDHNPEAKFILIGDNSENDPFIYQKVQQLYPKQILTIYMHKVVDRKNLPGQVSWISTLDIIYNEYLLKRVNVHELIKQYNELKDSKLSQIVPSKIYCPKDLIDWSLVPESETYSYVIEIAKDIVTFCRSRKG